MVKSKTSVLNSFVFYISVSVRPMEYPGKLNFSYPIITVSVYREIDYKVREERRRRSKTVSGVIFVTRINYKNLTRGK